MAVYSIVIMVILAVTMAIFIVLSILKEDSNNKKNQHNIIYPFNAKLQTRDKEHAGGITAPLVTSDGKTPQIQCPAGTHINIIGSWTDVVDPNGLCSPTVGSTFKLSCGFTDDTSAGITCNSDDSCADGMVCSGEQTCIPKPCNLNSECGSSGTSCMGLNSRVGEPCGSPTDYQFTDADGYVCMNGTIQKDPSAGQCLYCRFTDNVTGEENPAAHAAAVAAGDKVSTDNPGLGRCAQSPTCGNLNAGGQNKMCLSKSCAPRDSSAYLADLCDGKRTCKITYNPADSTGFGPKPCQGLNVVWQKPTGGDVSEFEKLPVAPGWGGGTSAGGDGSAQPSTYSLGYYVHGLYTCQPDDE